MVGVERFELPTHCSQSSCATRLRYTPKNLIVLACFNRNPSSCAFVNLGLRYTPKNLIVLACFSRNPSSGALINTGLYYTSKNLMRARMIGPHRVRVNG